MPPLLVTAAVIIDQDRILITRRPEESRFAGLWEFPGGKIEENETPPQALIREIREELDLTIAVNAIAEVVHYCYDWGAVLILAYFCRIEGGTLRHIGVSDHRWVSADELDDYPLLPADRPIVVRLQQMQLSDNK